MAPDNGRPPRSAFGPRMEVISDEPSPGTQGIWRDVSAGVVD